MLVKLLFGVCVELIVLLHEGLLWAYLLEVVALAVCRRDALGFVATARSWRHRLDLLNDGLARVNLVKHSEEAS